MKPVATVPAFPNDVPVHSLPVIDFGLIKLHHKQEIDRLGGAGTSLGFW